MEQVAFLHIVLVLRDSYGMLLCSSEELGDSRDEDTQGKIEVFMYFRDAC